MRINHLKSARDFVKSQSLAIMKTNNLKSKYNYREGTCYFPVFFRSINPLLNPDPAYGKALFCYSLELGYEVTYALTKHLKRGFLQGDGILTSTGITLLNQICLRKNMSYSNPFTQPISLIDAIKIYTIETAAIIEDLCIEKMAEIWGRPDRGDALLFRLSFNKKTFASEIIVREIVFSDLVKPKMP